MRIGCIIQARTGSTRLPNKINADIGGRTMLWHVVTRMQKVADLEAGVIVAWDHDYQELDANDVLSRYVLCARRNSLDAVMRITGDCPLIAPGTCQRVLKRFLHGFDYVANDLVATYPNGLGCEVFTREAIEYAHRHVSDSNPADREHVTPFIIRGARKGQFYASNVRCPMVGVEHLKFSVDTQDDLDRVRAIDAALPRDFSLEATLEAYERSKINSGVAA